MASIEGMAAHETNESGSKLSSTLGDDAAGHHKQSPASGLARVSKLLHSATSHRKQGPGLKLLSHSPFGRRSSLGNTPSYGSPSILVDSTRAPELPSDQVPLLRNSQAFPAFNNGAGEGDIADELAEPPAIERRRSTRSIVGHIDHSDPAFRARAESNPYLADARFSFSTPSLIFSSSKSKMPRTDGLQPGSFFPGLDAYYFASNVNPPAPKPASSSRSKGKHVPSNATKSGTAGRLSLDHPRANMEDLDDLYVEDPSIVAAVEGSPSGWSPESDINNVIHPSATKPLQRSSSTRHSSATASGARASRTRKNSLHAPREHKDKTWNHTPTTSGAMKRTAVAYSGPGIDLPLLGGPNGVFTVGTSHTTTVYMSSNSQSERINSGGLTSENGEASRTTLEAEHQLNKTQERDDRPQFSKSFVWKNNKRHHALPSSKAPYPRSYDYRAIDCDTTDHLFLTTLVNSLSWHDFAPNPVESPPPPPSSSPEAELPPKENAPSTTVSAPFETEPVPKPPVLEHPTTARPKMVLDLGCGNGVWVMDAAKQWTDAHFVGLDLVPIQPNLSVVAPALKNRIEWVNANFLEPLPFPNSHFDYVHIRRIARGVPENKWDALFEEVSRVLKPNGALEVFEEDLIFPGGSEQCTCHYPPDRAEEQDQFEDKGRMSYDSQTPMDQYMSPPDTPMGFPMSTTTSTAPGPSLFSPLSDADTVNKYVPSTETHHHPTTGGLFYDASHSVNVRDHRRLEQMYNDMHQDKFINLSPISLLTSILPLWFRDVRSHPPVLTTFPPAEETMWSDTSSSASESDTGIGTHASEDNDSLKEKEPKKKKRLGRSALGKSRPSTANSSLGSSAFDSSFGGSPKQSRLSIEQQLDEHPEEGETINPVENPSAASKATAESRGYMHHPPPGGWHNVHVDLHALVHPKQPFIMIDRCRIPALLPAHLPSHGDSNSPPDKESKAGTAARLMTRLPNLTFNMDLQTLTLSLARTVTEVVECKEAIWDYMVQTGQARPTEGAVYGFGTGVGMSVAGTPGAISAIRGSVASASAIKSPIAQSNASGASVSPRVRPANIKVNDSIVDRDEFDAWVARYERDMHERVQMAKAMRGRLDWKPRDLSSADYHPSAPSTNTHRHAHSVSSGAKDQISPIIPKGPPLAVTGTVYVPRPQLGMDITGAPPCSMEMKPTSQNHSSSSSEEIGSGLAPLTRMDLSSTSLLGEDDTGGRPSSPTGIRQRTGSAPERVPSSNNGPNQKSSTLPVGMNANTHAHPHRHHAGHSRAHSLDAANAWELLAQENSNLGSFLPGQKTALAADTAKSSPEYWEDELPKLSRCVKVFVAWNNKTD